MERSTRLSILEHALADVVDRLAELPVTQDISKLRELARQYEVEVDLWREHPPDEGQRNALLKRVLDLNVEVIRAGAPASRPFGEDPDDEDFPKKV